MESKVLVFFLHHLDDIEQEVKDELCNEGSEADSEEVSTYHRNICCDFSKHFLIYVLSYC